MDVKNTHDRCRKANSESLTGIPQELCNTNKKTEDKRQERQGRREGGRAGSRSVILASCLWLENTDHLPVRRETGDASKMSLLQYRYDNGASNCIQK